SPPWRGSFESEPRNRRRRLGWRSQRSAPARSAGSRSTSLGRGEFGQTKHRKDTQLLAAEAPHTSSIWPPSGHIFMFPGVLVVDVRPRGAPNGDQTWHFATRVTPSNMTSRWRRKWREKSANSCAATS